MPLMDVAIVVLIKYIPFGPSGIFENVPIAVPSVLHARNTGAVRAGLPVPGVAQ